MTYGDPRGVGVSHERGNPAIVSHERGNPVIPEPRSLHQVRADGSIKLRMAVHLYLPK